MARSPPVAMDLSPYYKYVRPLPIVRNRATKMQCTSYLQADGCMSSDGMHALQSSHWPVVYILPTWRAGLWRVRTKVDGINYV